MKDKSQQNTGAQEEFTLNNNAKLTQFIRNFSANNVTPTTRAFYTEYMTHSSANSNQKAPQTNSQKGGASRPAGQC